MATYTSPCLTGISPDEILEIGESFSYYTSPGGINERVAARLVELRTHRRPALAIANYTKFSDAGSVRELDAHQTLRACHVGGMFDARLEINIYRLLRSLGLPFGAWIGAPIELTVQPAFSRDGASDPLSPARAGAFEELSDVRSPAFLAVNEGTFRETSLDGRALAEVDFEYVVPKRLSRNTVVVLPVVRTVEGILVGIEHRDLPAVQTFSGSSRIAAAPAWRTPDTVKHRGELPSFASRVLSDEFKVRVRKSWELGGSYFATPGVTPEVVFPMVAEIDSTGLDSSILQFIEIGDLASRLSEIHDAHLLITASRLIHANLECDAPASLS